ncbi:DUF6788 family protein [Leptolyngbya sp. FACHB-17]|uniref:DUF6788 family protein n=1 Tax=unclassified Leptolyngbya TaxID=2650499 RepID=UPI00168114BE|nr:DUF6788 family protein [Leptolyngbya sp. FACHB-17]MBD2080506.1 hypothetical protein [Leptolyngbya sp. FACHB-17]
MAKRPDIDKLRTAFGRLTLAQAKQLYAELGDIVRSLEQQSVHSEAVTAKGREVIETQRSDDPNGIGGAARLYQLELVRCGKAGCKCAGIDGELHGPYWYAYWRENGKLKSRYVGKRFRQI